MVEISSFHNNRKLQKAFIRRFGFKILPRELCDDARSEGFICAFWRSDPHDAYITIGFTDRTRGWNKSCLNDRYLMHPKVDLNRTNFWNIHLTKDILKYLFSHKAKTFRYDNSKLR